MIIICHFEQNNPKVAKCKFLYFASVIESKHFFKLNPKFFQFNQIFLCQARNHDFWTKFPHQMTQN